MEPSYKVLELTELPAPTGEARQPPRSLQEPGFTDYVD
jgi:hypothetical protein